MIIRFNGISDTTMMQVEVEDSYEYIQHVNLASSLIFSLASSGVIICSIILEKFNHYEYAFQAEKGHHLQSFYQNI